MRWHWFLISVLSWQSTGFQKQKFLRRPDWYCKPFCLVLWLGPESEPDLYALQDEPEIVPLRCIQTEETAMKELSELYGAQGSETTQPQTAAPDAPSVSGAKKSRPRSRQSYAHRNERRRKSSQTPKAERPRKSEQS